MEYCKYCKASEYYCSCMLCENCGVKAFDYLSLGCLNCGFRDEDKERPRVSGLRRGTDG